MNRIQYLFWEGDIHSGKCLQHLMQLKSSAVYAYYM